MREASGKQRAKESERAKSGPVCVCAEGEGERAKSRRRADQARERKAAQLEPATRLRLQIDRQPKKRATKRASRRQKDDR